jgi:hypothetical protein
MNDRAMNKRLYPFFAVMYGCKFLKESKLSSARHNVLKSLVCQYSCCAKVSQPPYHR